MVDSLKIYDVLKTANIPEAHARAMTEAIQRAESDIALDVRTVLKQELDNFARIFATKSELAEMESRLMRWMFIFWVGQMTATVVVFKFLK